MVYIALYFQVEQFFFFLIYCLDTFKVPGSFCILDITIFTLEFDYMVGKKKQKKT